MPLSHPKPATPAIIACATALLTACAPSPAAAIPQPLPTTPQPASLSAATTSPVLLPATLKFSRDSMRSIQAGTKFATIRKGVRAFPAGVIKAISGGTESLILQNVATTPKKFADLTEADAKANGSDSLDQLKEDLQADYPGIQPTDTVTVITFKLAPVDNAK